MPQQQVTECLRKNLRRALIISIVVGSALVLINHGDHLEMEPVCSNFGLKVLLSYCVPFMVSMVSAVLASHERVS